MANAEETAGEPRPIDERVAKLLEAQRHSGKSVAAFAREHGIQPWRLYQAGQPRRTGKKRKRRRRSEFVEVGVKAKEPEAPVLEIVVPGDLRVRVPRHFDESTLRRLLGVLASC